MSRGARVDGASWQELTSHSYGRDRGLDTKESGPCMTDPQYEEQAICCQKEWQEINEGVMGRNQKKHRLESQAKQEPWQKCYMGAPGPSSTCCMPYCIHGAIRPKPGIQTATPGQHPASSCGSGGPSLTLWTACHCLPLRSSDFTQ